MKFAVVEGHGRMRLTALPAPRPCSSQPWEFSSQVWKATCCEPGLRVPGIPGLPFQTAHAFLILRG